MTSLLAFISLATVLAGSLCPSSVPFRSHFIPGKLQPMVMSREAAGRTATEARARRAGSQRAGSAQLRPSLPRRTEEPAAVILYGDGPWSWM